MLGQTTAPTRTPTSHAQATHALVRQHDRGGSERTTLRDGDPATAEAPARPLPSPSPALGAHGLALIPPSHPSSRRPPGRSATAFRRIERIRNGAGDPKQSSHQFTRSSTRRVPRWPKPKPGTPLHASRSRWVVWQSKTRPRKGPCQAVSQEGAGESGVPDRALSAHPPTRVSAGTGPGRRPAASTLATAREGASPRDRWRRPSWAGSAPPATQPH